MSRLRNWIRIAILDLRGDLKHFGVLLACLALGTMTIAAVGSVGDALQTAIATDATKLMGGDIEASRSDRRATADEISFLQTLGPVAEVDDSNGRAIAGDNTAFLDLVAVDGDYPLVGNVESPQLKGDAKPGTLLDNRNGVWGALVDPVVLDRLGIKLGDQFVIGSTQYQARGILGSLPDGAARGFHLGISTMISVDALAATPDARPPLPGMLTQYRYKVVLNQKNLEDPTASYAAGSKAVSDHFNNDPAWKTQSPRDAAGDLARYYDLFTQFLLIVGLSALLVGGVGVSNAVSAYINERQRSIATMRSLGATSNRILVHFLVQLGVLSIIGVAIGAAIGAAATALFLPLLGKVLVVDLPPSVHPIALLTAVGFGLLVAFGFSFLPLVRAQEMKPAILFRSVGAAVEGGRTRGAYAKPRNFLPILISAVLIFLLAWATTKDIKLVSWYTLGVIGAFLLLRIAGIALQAALRLVPPLPITDIRNAIKAVYRPGSPAPVVILSLGLGLAMLLLIVLIDNNTRNQLQGQVTRDAPSFVATDLFPDEVTDLNKLAQTDKNFDRVVAVPSYTGKVTAIKGVPADQIKNAGEEVAFLLRGDIPVTWAANLPEGSTIISGQWWPADYKGEPLISLRTTTAAALGVKVGDEIDFNLYNQDVKAKVGNIRDYKFQSMAMNFLVTFSPNALEGLPGTFMAGIKTVPGAEKPVERELAQQYPDLTFIPIGDALNQAANILDQLSTAVDVVGGLAVLNGLLVLAGTMAAGRAQREADAVVTKVLGATRGDVIRAFVLEYSILGAFAALLAAVLGVIGAWAITVYALQVDYAIDIGLIAIVIVFTVALTIATGAATTWSALSTKPAQFLRTE